MTRKVGDIFLLLFAGSIYFSPPIIVLQGIMQANWLYIVIGLGLGAFFYRNNITNKKHEKENYGYKNR